MNNTTAATTTRAPSAANSYAWMTVGSQYIAWIIGPLGIVSSLLTILCLRRSKFEKLSFYVYMLLIAIFDLLFNLANILCHIDSITRTSPVYIVSYGLVYSLSLYSDLCALALTIERFVSLQWPHAHLGIVRRRFLRAISIITIIVLGATRMSYGLVPLASLVSSDLRARFVAVKAGFEMFHAMILPFVLGPLMILFSVWTVAIVRRRKKKTTTTTKANWISPIDDIGPSVESIGRAWDPQRKQPPRRQVTMTNKLTDEQLRAANIQKEKDDRTQSIVRLIYVLEFLFILNQYNYCQYAASALYQTGCNRCPEGAFARNFALFSGDLLECASRSANFYLYLCFSSMIRTQFFGMLRAIKQVLVRD